MAFYVCLFAVLGSQGIVVKCTGHEAEVTQVRLSQQRLISRVFSAETLREHEKGPGNEVGDGVLSCASG